MTRFAFVAGETGAWRIGSMKSISGLPLAPAPRMAIVPAEDATADAAAVWRLDGVVSNVRYATRIELGALRAQHAPLRRPQARLGALIPIKKSESWWALAQDERRAIFEEQSHHTALGLKYLPQIARQLYHCRDIGQPFDFLTWFEYAPEHAAAFEELVAGLRVTPEWRFVEREIDIRLELDPARA